MPPKTKRSVARFASVQALFQVYAQHTPVEEVIDDFCTQRFTPEGAYALFDEGLYPVDIAHFTQLVRGVYKVRNTLDEEIAKHLPAHWSIDRLERSTYCLLQCGTFELLYLSDVPTSVILDEYVTVAHGFLLEKGYALTNALLQAVAQNRRPKA